MEQPSNILKKREDVTSSAIKRVGKIIPVVQSQINSEILKFLRTLEVDSNGDVKANSKNLIAVNKFVNTKIRFMLKSGEYNQNAKQFIDTIKQIGILTKEYFKAEVK